MPQFLFRVVDGELVPDAEGIELPDLDSACRDAADILADCLKGSGQHFWQARKWDLEITDTAGTVLAMLTVSAKLFS